MGRIDSGILQQQLSELILVGFKVLVQVVPLIVVHVLGTFILIVIVYLAVAILSLRIITIILIGVFLMLPGSLHHGWEENEGPLIVVVKEFLELVS